MRSNSREEIVEAFDALTAALDTVLNLDCDVLTPQECVAMLTRCETARRQLPAIEHPLINQLQARATLAELGGTPRTCLADRLHINRGEARRRVQDAAMLGPRRALTGQALPPLLPATAAAQRAGALGAAHVAVIRGFFDYLPAGIDAATRAHCEARLAALGTRYRPDEHAKLAQRMAEHLHPDGNFSDEQRALRRGVTLGRQGRDGMSAITGHLDPQARATLDAVLARWAAPGMCNPADESPCTSATPTQAHIDNDHRSTAQRTHDALTALCRAMLGSRDLGQHNGLPATLIISASLAELSAYLNPDTSSDTTAKAHTGGGTWLPMSDVVRIASHAHHYLRIYDGARELALFHTKRLANPAQRIVLYAKERGCSHPGCPAPGYLCEVHHDDDYAATHRTDITGLTFRCGPDHKLLSHGWKTRKRADGTTETLPPPHLDHGQARINYFHHPEKLLHDKDNDNDDDPN